MPFDPLQPAPQWRARNHPTISPRRHSCEMGWTTCPSDRPKHSSGSCGLSKACWQSPMDERLAPDSSVEGSSCDPEFDPSPAVAADPDLERNRTQPKTKERKLL